MPTIKFTPAAIAKLKAPTKSRRKEFYWDSDLRGFGILLSGKTSSRTYVVQKQIAGSGKKPRVRIGAANVLALEEARRKALDVLRELADGKDPRVERRRKAVAGITLSAALERFLDDRRDLSATVHYRWPKYLQTYLGDWLARPLSELTKDVVTERRDKIIKDVAARAFRRSPAFLSEPGLGAANQTMTAFKAIRAHVAEEAGLPPMQIPKKRGSTVKRRERCLHSEQMPAFYSAVMALESRRDKDLILTLLFSGLRFGEAASLRWDDIDFPQRAIRLPAARVKARRRLDLPMTSQLRDILVQRQSIGREGQFVFPAVPRTTTTGHATDLSHAFYEIKRTSGTYISPHDLRRTWATVAESCDISWSALQALLNHAAPSGVTGGYTVMALSRLQTPAQLVADRIGELCGIVEAAGVTKLG
jgi:integrase